MEVSQLFLSETVGHQYGIFGGASLRPLWYKLRWGAMRHCLTNIRPERLEQGEKKSQESVSFDNEAHPAYTFDLPLLLRNK